MQTVHVQPGVGSTAVPLGVWSSGLVKVKIEFGQVTQFGPRFLVSGGEVRPRNTAVSIWRRIH